MLQLPHLNFQQSRRNVQCVQSKSVYIHAQTLPVKLKEISVPINVEKLLLKILKEKHRERKRHAFTPV